MAVITQSGASIALAALLADLVSYQVGLFETLPLEPDGSDGVESSFAGYTRKSSFLWNVHHTTEGSFVANSSAVALPLATEAATVVGWGVWDLSGNLLAFGPLQDEAGENSPVSLANGDGVTFNAFDLQIGLGGGL